MKTLTLVTDLPTGLAEFTLLQDWADRVGTASGGELNIQVFAAGQLVGAFETVDAVQSGFVDLFYTSPNYHPDSFSGVEAFEVPFSAGADAASAAAAWQTIQDGAFETSGFRFLTAHISGSDVLVAQNDLGQLDGLKIRSSGLASTIVSTLGSFGISMPAGELGIALAVGLIDGAILPSYFANGYQFDESFSYYTSTDGTLVHPRLRAMAMTESGWDALTAAEQSLLAAHTGLAQSEVFGAQTAALFAQALAEFGSTPFSPAQMAAWDAAVASVQATFDPVALALVEAFAANLAALPEIVEVTGTSDDDRLNGTEADDHVSGLAGDDVLVASAGYDRLDGGEGVDTADYSGATGPVGLFLNQGKAVGAFDRDRLEQIENLIGSDYNDTIIGDSGTNILNGGLGDDVLRGKGGDNTLIGGLGNDRIFGEDGAETVSGGRNDDVIKTAGGDDTVLAGSGADVVRLGQGNDTAQGESGRDRMYGNRGNDTIDGGSGDDRLYGGGNNDILHGGQGDDALRGEGGRDFLFGGAGDDNLYGGDQLDVFVFVDDGLNGADRIKDWQDGLDQIDLVDFGFSSFAQAQAIASNAGSSNMKLDFGAGNQVVIENFRYADFDQTDVILLA